MARSAPRPCGTCRRARNAAASSSSSSQVADELLLLAPVQEPPAGFESRVVEAMGLQESTPAAAWPAGCPALAGAEARPGPGHGGDHRGRADRRLPRRPPDCRALPREPDPGGRRYFQTEQLAEQNGDRGGVAFGYEGSPSWVLLTVDPAHRDAVTRGELLTRDGRTIPLPSIELDRNGSWGGAIPVNLYQVASIRLLGDSPEDILQASFPAGPEAD